MRSWPPTVLLHSMWGKEDMRAWSEQEWMQVLRKKV